MKIEYNKSFEQTGYIDVRIPSMCQRYTYKVPDKYRGVNLISYPYLIVPMDQSYRAVKPIEMVPNPLNNNDDINFYSPIKEVGGIINTGVTSAKILEEGIKEEYVVFGVKNDGQVVQLMSREDWWNMTPDERRRLLYSPETKLGIKTYEMAVWQFMMLGSEGIKQNGIYEVTPGQWEEKGVTPEPQYDHEFTPGLFVINDRYLLGYRDV